MNRARRTRLAKCVKQLTEILNEVENCQQEEEDYFDNLPYGLEQSPNGSASFYAYDDLEEAADDINSAMLNIKKCID